MIMLFHSRDHALEISTPGKAAVSVIVPCYLCADTIDRAVASIAEQVMLPNEVLLVNDASPDNGLTATALQYVQKKYEGHLNIRIISRQQNGGAGAARNAGWAEATQPYIAFLDSDDAWHTHKIAIQFRWMEQNPETILVGSPVVELKSTQLPRNLFNSVQAKSVSKAGMLFSNKFFTSSVMCKKDIKHRFLEHKRYSEDYLLWLEIICSYGRAQRIELPLAFAFKPIFGSAGLSKNLWKMERGELDVYRRMRKCGNISGYLYLFCVTFSLLKYLRRLLLTQIRRR